MTSESPLEINQVAVIISVNFLRQNYIGIYT